MAYPNLAEQAQRVAGNEGYCPVCGGAAGELHEDWCECKLNYRIGDEEKIEKKIAESQLHEIRQFDTGATRDRSAGKPDYEGFLSPIALVRYGEYMNEHRTQADGKMRASDNWQKGIPLEEYASSLLRHVMDAWLIHRGYGVCDQDDGHTITVQEALCGIIFNAFGYLHEVEKSDAL